MPPDASPAPCLGERQQTIPPARRQPSRFTQRNARRRVDRSGRRSGSDFAERAETGDRANGPRLQSAAVSTIDAQEAM
ncbi:hypothetical protein GCM10017673_48570 [Streptosporangium violaceochromogenes]|nr:hypothetical protein GCM10017673_48570 [Streptosporangium violaceochromogenes]